MCGRVFDDRAVRSDRSGPFAFLWRETAINALGTLPAPLASTFTLPQTTGSAPGTLGASAWTVGSSIAIDRGTLLGR